VKFALAMNLADFLVKSTAAYMTLSNSLFAESLHSSGFAYLKEYFTIFISVGFCKSNNFISR
jgi:divalent metal cation (Fe/Co/Zn/Cd) transporter